MVHPLTQWAENKPLGLVVFAQLLAYSADDVHELLNLILAEDSRLPGPRGDAEEAEWNRYYSNHNYLLHKLLLALGVRPKRITEIASFLKLQNWMNKADPEVATAYFNQSTESQWSRGVKNSQQIIQILLRLHQEEIDILPGTGFSGNLKGPQIQDSLPLRFFLKVSFPCFLFYKKWPGKLLREATCDTYQSRKALKSIVQLDKHVQNHQRVKWLQHHAPKQVRGSVRRQLSQAITGRPRKMSLKKVKHTISGLIVHISKCFDARLLEPEIRKLFDIIATLKNEVLTDSDIAISPESFSKAIQREGRSWNTLPMPDKKTLKHVRGLRSRLI